MMKYLAGMLCIMLFVFGASAQADDKTALQYYQNGYLAERNGDIRGAISWYRKAVSERYGDGQITIPGEVSYQWVETPRGMMRQKIQSRGSTESYYPGQRLDKLLAQEKQIQQEQRSDDLRRQKFMNPPQLQVSLELLDANNNRAIEGGEEGKLLITVSNDGQSRADEVMLKLSINSRDIELDQQVELGNIDAGKSLVKAIPYRASRSLKDGEISLKVKGTERDGFDAAEAQLRTMAMAYQPPELLIARGDVRAGEGNLLLVSYQVSNVGVGVARDVQVLMNIDQRMVLRDESHFEQRLGALQPNETRNLEFGVYTSIRAGEPLPIALTVREASLDRDLRHDLALQVPAQQGGRSAVGASVAYTPIATRSRVENVGLQIPQGSRKEQLAVGVVIGNGNYRSLDPVRFALQDATTVADYVVKTMGFEPRGVQLEKDLASRDFRRLFGTRERGFKDGTLYRRVELNARRRENPPVFVYYSGHGAPSMGEDGKAYLVPVDTALRDLEYEGYPLTDFYASLAALPSDNVTVVIDSCFSGSSNDGLLQKDISPAMLRTADTITPADTGNATIFTSTAPSQVSYWYNEASHSLFTYYFLKGLRGDADQNNDGRITSGELHDYLSWNVESYILDSNKPSDQTPQLVGDTERLMAAYE